MACIVLVEDNAFIREAAAGYLQLDGHTILEFDCVKGVADTVRRESLISRFSTSCFPMERIQSRETDQGDRGHSSSSLPRNHPSRTDPRLNSGRRLRGKTLFIEGTRASVQALLKRYSQTARQGDDVCAWTLDDNVLKLDSASHRLSVNGEELYLTDAEWKILKYLAVQEGLVVSRERLLSECLNYFFEGSERTIDTHIANLRGKLGSSVWIETVRGYGYRFAGARNRSD